jgi:tetratricopeptide (TPR) repeat protein
MEDLGAAIERAWDFEDPAGSEARLRALLTDADGQDALVLRTQVARALGLQQRYDEAQAVLDEVAAAASPGTEARVRERLERGRVLRSGGDPDRARPLFAEAAALAGRLLTGLRIDALHMTALLAGSPAEQAALTEAVLAEARADDDPAARRWVPSLLNNLGMARHDAGDLAGALAAFEEALAVRRERGEHRETQIATWMVAWVLRLLGRDDEALRIQTALKAELEAEGATDPYVDEEIATLRQYNGR